MSESEDLRDILYNELANLTIFMRLLKYAVARQKMIKCFSVSHYHLNKLFLMCLNKQNRQTKFGQMMIYSQFIFLAF